MPIITVEMFEGRTKEQRQAFAKQVTDAAVDTLKAPIDHTWVIFRESPHSSWAFQGKLCGE